MPWDKQTFNIIADFGKSHFVDVGDSEVNPPAGYLRLIPDLWQGDGFELIVDCYELFFGIGDADTVESDFDDGAATTKLFLKRADSVEDPIELDGTGTITALTGGGGGLGKLTYQVAQGAITTFYSGQDVLLYGETKLSTTEKRTWAQRLTIISDDGDASATLASKNIAVSESRIVGRSAAPGVNDDATLFFSVGDYIWDDVGTQLYRCDDNTTAAAIWTAVSVLDDYPGFIRYLFETGTADADAALPLATAQTQQDIEFVHATSDANTASIIGTVNGDAGPITLDPGERASAHIVSDGTLWYNLNYTVVVT